MGPSILSSLLYYQFGVLSLCFSGRTVSFIQAVLFVLADTDLKLSEIYRSVGYPALIFLPEVIISTAEIQCALSCGSFTRTHLYLHAIVLPQNLREVGFSAAKCL